MGAGISSSRARSVRYQMIKKVEYKLARAGVPVTYVRGSLSFGPSDEAGGFSVSVGSIGPASNGEGAFYIQGLLILPDGTREIYGDFLSGHKVVDRIIEVYGDKSRLP